MTTTYTGNKTGITGASVVSIENPSDADPKTAASNNLPVHRLADFVKYLVDHMVRQGGASGDPLEMAISNPELPAFEETVGTPATGVRPFLQFPISVDTLCKMRFYAAGDASRPGGMQGIYITINAHWDGTIWRSDVAQTASRLYILSDRIGMDRTAQTMVAPNNNITWLTTWEIDEFGQEHRGSSSFLDHSAAGGATITDTGIRAGKGAVKANLNTVTINHSGVGVNSLIMVTPTSGATNQHFYVDVGAGFFTVSTGVGPPAFDRPFLWTILSTS
jgi:hypothetical protein